MRNYFLLAFCLLPSICVCLHFAKLNKAIVVFRDLQQLFTQIHLILNSSLLEIALLLRVAEDRNICPYLCRTVYEAMDAGESFSDSWSNAFEDKKYNVLTLSEKKQLLSFADRFGRGTIEDQYELCKQYDSFCFACMQEKKVSLIKNGKLSMTGSILLGAFFYVVLL